MTALHRVAVLALLALVALPVLATAAMAMGALLDASAWRALWHDTQWRRALGLSAWTGLASTLLAWWCSAALLAQGFVRRSLVRLLRGLPVMLATPHAAFAIGLVFLVAPSGWLLRLFSPWLTGFNFPPPWPTTQDPWGLGLIVALVAKEIPFLLWTAATQLQRDDVRRRWQAEHAIAQTLGYAPRRAFWRVVWPQLAPRLFWPLMAVLAYGLTVVDMALVIGPAAPPTLAVLAWQWLRDADLAINAQGAAAGGVLAIAVLLLGAGWRGAQLALSTLSRYPSGRRGQAPLTGSEECHAGSLTWSFIALTSLYGAVLLVLAVGSVAGVWPFPYLWPERLTDQAWISVWASRGTVFNTLGLAAASAGLALAWSVAWLELAPRRWDNALRPVLYLPLVLPTVLWVVGLYALALQWRIEGHWIGLLVAHSLMALPYVSLALSPAYLGFDPRYGQLSASLGHGRWSLLWRIKWPLLRRALAASAAVGFAVSVAQYLPTLYIGAGRFTTVTTEAVTLAAGAQRSLTSAYAWLQFVLPVLGFALAAWVGRPRQFKVQGS
ncbi:ABC transporter permease [Hydrogenophaga sp.]|uniref:ABC transporter permease n=1 Tax=Hydrogenophaga sp. TaxID=1904254 RepID=UPI00271E4868|nr:ABC transporter permease subunit [Hydrogenophaga sp.]MDO8905367.1 ABC transporter permease subunit [Hydrogenophaga sp.]